MKARHLLALVFAALLYLRQREVEATQRAWRKQRDAELSRFAQLASSEVDRFGKEVNTMLDGWATQIREAFQRDKQLVEACRAMTLRPDSERPRSNHSERGREVVE